MMEPEKHIFNISGPTYLKSIDWNDPDHRMCVMASLVQGVYVHEHDRLMDRTGPESVASPWWEFFHFHLIETLRDSDDSSFIGAILQLKDESGKSNVVNSPEYVIAFRGIINKLPEPILEDSISCIRSYFGTLHNSPRFQHALDRVRHWVGVAGGGTPNVWLTGHSLGSAMALLAAKNMVMSSGRGLPTYLFNPPFPSAVLERTKNPILARVLHITSSVAKAGVCAYFDKELEGRDEFCALRDWVPCMFLNPGDPICSGYISYFEQRLKMRRLGAEGLEGLATRHTLKSLIMSNVLDIDSEPFHLLPSAELIINEAESTECKVDHGIKQWWDHTLRPRREIHRYHLPPTSNIHEPTSS